VFICSSGLGADIERRNGNEKEQSVIGMYLAGGVRGGVQRPLPINNFIVLQSFSFLTMQSNEVCIEGKSFAKDLQICARCIHDASSLELDVCRIIASYLHSLSAIKHAAAPVLLHNDGFGAIRHGPFFCREELESIYETSDLNVTTRDIDFSKECMESPFLEHWIRTLVEDRPSAISYTTNCTLPISELQINLSIVYPEQAQRRRRAYRRAKRNLQWTSFGPEESFNISLPLNSSEKHSLGIWDVRTNYFMGKEYCESTPTALHPLLVQAARPPPFKDTIQASTWYFQCACNVQRMHHEKCISSSQSVKQMNDLATVLLVEIIRYLQRMNAHMQLRLAAACEYIGPTFDSYAGVQLIQMLQNEFEPTTPLYNQRMSCIDRDNSHYGLWFSCDNCKMQTYVYENHHDTSIYLGVSSTRRIEFFPRMKRTDHHYEEDEEKI
jgi:hypothetical protein